MIVVVAVCGGAGAVLRFVVDGLVARGNRLPVPMGTVVVNVLGSFLLGLLTGLAVGPDLDAVRAAVGTGLLGGFTTFSTASVEAVDVARTGGSRAVLLAGGHALGMLVVALAAAAVGWSLA